MDASHPAADLVPGAPDRLAGAWRARFLEALAETSSVTAARRRAMVSQAHVHRARRTEPEFARQWLLALCEGYDHLEMELLGRLRAGEARQHGGVKHDNRTAIRLLGQHRANAERGGALRDNDDEQAVLDSIDALFREMRERAAANAAILAEDTTRGHDAGR